MRLYIYLVEFCKLFLRLNYYIKHIFIFICINAHTMPIFMWFNFRYNHIRSHTHTYTYNTTHAHTFLHACVSIFKCIYIYIYDVYMDFSWKMSVIQSILQQCTHWDFFSFASSFYIFFFLFFVGVLLDFVRFLTKFFLWNQWRLHKDFIVCS